jgi:hypothetical protein
MIAQQGPRTTRARVTVPLVGRSIIRAPFLSDMRARLSLHCTPQWEAGPDIWTVPRSACQPALEVVLAAFEQASVSIEVERDGGGTDWLTYEIGQDQPDRIPESLTCVTLGHACAVRAGA